MVMCIFLSLACLFDYSLRRIPNFLILCMAAVGVGGFVTRGEPVALLFSIATGLVILMVAFPLYRLGMFGAGDLKTVAVCSLFLGGSDFVRFIVVALTIAALFSIAKILIKHNSRERIAYLFEYASDVVRNRAFKLYMVNKDNKDATICLMGPVLISGILVVGGL
ncbi:MAG: prepilin peptidase [Lachnospiraceae bacterium]|nr:prepilin peptidase [Lachnospiraceae bacterium]